MLFWRGFNVSCQAKFFPNSSLNLFLWAELQSWSWSDCDVWQKRAPKLKTTPAEKLQRYARVDNRKAAKQPCCWTHAVGQGEGMRAGVKDEAEGVWKKNPRAEHAANSTTPRIPTFPSYSGSALTHNDLLWKQTRRSGWTEIGLESALIACCCHPTVCARY